MFGCFKTTTNTESALHWLKWDRYPWWRQFFFRLHSFVTSKLPRSDIYTCHAINDLHLGQCIHLILHSFFLSVHSLDSNFISFQMCSNRSNYVQMGLIININFAGRYDIRLWIVISRLYGCVVLLVLPIVRVAVKDLLGLIRIENMGMWRISE